MGEDEQAVQRRALAAMRARVYSRGATDEDRKALARLIVEAELDGLPPEPEIDDVSRTAVRRRVKAVLAATLVVLAGLGALEFGSGSTARPMRDLLVARRADLTAQWRRAEIVTVRNSVRGSVQLSMPASAAGSRLLLVISCTEPSPWTVVTHVGGEPQLSGSGCGAFVARPLIPSPAAVRVYVDGGASFGVAILAAR